uniref:RALBP1 associated Eps domain containing 2 n=1 Tax=Cyclopterus lumpus TaxID=8103 RepID=A0A8C3G535_CYCLU
MIFYSIPSSLLQVTELCGAKRLGFFNTPQFFVALKLLAAAQSELPIHLESITANLPLPRFTGLKNEPEMRYAVVPPSADGQGAQTGTGTGTGTGSVSWTPADRRHPEDHVDRKVSSGGVDLIPAAAERPRCCEIRGSFRTSSSERLDQQGLVDSPDDAPWRITEEQLEYYTNQFRSLQPDLGALIRGTIAKNFFTKSKLPIPELSHIWELSDVDRDGALSFPEFCVAFHLIVARKNGFPLPERLPPTLRTGLLQSDRDQDSPDTPEVRQRGVLKVLRVLLQVEGSSRSYSSTSVEDAMKKAEEPPTPPPRPQKTHSRASSLDLNKLFQQGTPGTTRRPPPVLQRVSSGCIESGVKPEDRGPRSRLGPSSEDLETASKQVPDVVSLSQAPQKPVRRKYHAESQNLETTPTKPAQKPPSKQKREIQTAIRKNKESNAVLTRLNSELQQQLKVSRLVSARATVPASCV